MEPAVITGIAVFVVGVVFQMGRFAARIEKLEEWRAEQRQDMDKLYEELRHIRALITGDETR